MALVGVVIGSKTDTELIQPAQDMLRQLSIGRSGAKNAALLVTQILAIDIKK